jgi:hypothetical protein
MTPEDIIRMAREADLLPSDSTFGYGAEVADLSRFAALAAAAEREACADICAQHASIEGIAQRCAEQIRARGKT